LIHERKLTGLGAVRLIGHRPLITFRGADAASRRIEMFGVRY
jgi:hypothetical protein